MKIIEKGNTNIAQLIKKRNIKDETFFRLSNFVYLFSDLRHHIAKYTLTDMIIEFSDDEWQLVSELKEKTITGGELRRRKLLYLAENCIVVEYDFDEYKHYKLAIHVLKTMSLGKNEGIKSYTILPTTACNARCIYCYEEGMAIRTMTPQIVDQVVDFICKTKRDDKILINWFGGEPLVAKDIISSICNKLNDRNICFSSKVITNGTLLTREIVKEIKSLWHLKSAQISVDGNKQDYEFRKRYYNPLVHNYDAMINAIAYLLEEDIKIAIRCNYDNKNLTGMREFLEDIKVLFGNSPNLLIYFAMLFQENDNKDSIEVRRKIINIIRYCHEIGMRCVTIPDKDYRMRVNYCMADSNGKHVVIDPDGFLYHCEHLPNNAAFGHITDEKLNIGSDNRVLMDVNPRCKLCCFLPYCTPFSRNACPNWFQYCYEIKCIDMDFILEQII